MVKLLPASIVLPGIRLCAAIFLLCVGLGALATGSAAQFASGVSLVEVYVSATAANGEPVRGLTRDDFRVEEDGAAQAISVFTEGELPLALAIGLDRSFSVPPQRLREAIAGVRALLDALRPGDRTMLVGIGSQADVLAPLGAARGATREALARVESWGTTPLHDATVAAIDAIEPASGRRALILLSDGDDRYSSLTATDVVAHARVRNVLVYPVALGPRRPPLFAELAVATGGRSFQAAGAAAVSSTLITIVKELRAQYLIGYAPSVPTSEGHTWRSIRVTVRQPGVRVRARDGYLARW